jgi:prophage antirepressor-like protein
MELAIAFDGQQIRTIKTDRGIEWVAADVCRVLGIASPASVLRNFKDSERGVHLMHTTHVDQEMTTVTEPGLYRLIMRSNKPEAERFREWLTHDVLTKKTLSLLVIPSGDQRRV